VVSARAPVRSPRPPRANSRRDRDYLITPWSPVREAARDCAPGRSRVPH
jgi:hypothetical protein